MHKKIGMAFINPCKPSIGLLFMPPEFPIFHRLSNVLNTNLYNVKSNT